MIGLQDEKIIELSLKEAVGEKGGSGGYGSGDGGEMVVLVKL